jgi:RNA polymerase sigma factor (sigma-70 family)
MDHSDAALIQACRGGDEAAWATLIGRYQRLVYSVPRRAGLDEEAAADIFQEVFVALVRGLDTLEQPGRVSAWLLTLTKRSTWRHLKRRIATRTSLTTLDESAEMLEDGEPLPEDVMLLMEEQHDVRTAMGEIDDRCQRLLRLLFYTPTPPVYAEIAVALGIAEGSIGPIRARCLERLQRRLQREAS